MDPEPSKKQDIPQWQAVSMVWDLLLTIAVPTVLFALGGRWLDRRFGSSPWFLVIGLFLSLAVVALLVVRKGKRISKQL